MHKHVAAHIPVQSTLMTAATNKQSSPFLSKSLIDWDGLHRTSCVSELRDECEQRSGIIEEYLWDLLSIVKELNASVRQTHQAARRLLIRDEEEERRFIMEDAQHEQVSFSAFTSNTIVALVNELERDARAALQHDELALRMRILQHNEVIARMHLVTFAMEGAYMIYHRTRPAWPLLVQRANLRSLEQRIRVERHATLLLALQEEESDERCVMENSWHRCINIAHAMRQNAIISR